MMQNEMKKQGTKLKLVTSVRKKSRADRKEIPLRTTIDLFCGAGGITEGFREEIGRAHV